MLNRGSSMRLDVDGVSKQFDKSLSLKDDENEVSDAKARHVLARIRKHSLDSQITMFVQTIRSSKERSRSLQNFTKNLEAKLRVYFPSCSLVEFGSMASGFGFNNSDLDIFMYIKGCRYPGFHDLDNKEKSLFIESLLKDEEELTNVSAISNAKIPIIKIQDRVTGIKCDINFTAEMGVKNSRFIKFYTSLDKRCAPFVMIVKYFCLKTGIIGSGLGQHLNSYTVVLMAIFYLQVRDILPTIAELQYGVEGDFCYCWNFAFDKNYCHTEKYDFETPAFFLKDFFFYYSTFDYDRDVICPLMGQPYEKQQLRSGYNLPRRMSHESKLGKRLIYDRMHLDSPLVVQDPFELQRNVSAAVNKQFVDSMIATFRRASDKLRYGKSLYDVLF